MSIRLKKIRSGGQTGADLGGLVAAKQLGLETGGYIPKGFLTECGPCPALGELYGLVETRTATYPLRTRLNVRNSDATAWFGRLNSRGYHCTRDAADDYEKPFRVISTPEALIEFLDEFNVEELNVAGNRASRNPDIHRFTAETIIAAWRLIKEGVTP
jgi:hypothetical protein